MTVQGNAKCPEIIPVTIGKQNKPLEVKLGPGFLIKGIVKDSDGKPLSGVKISGNRIVELRTLRIQMTTKTNGRFYLGWIPNEQTALSVTKKGLKSHRVTLRPDKQENNNIVIGGIKSVSGQGGGCGRQTGLEIHGARMNCMPAGMARSVSMRFRPGTTASRPCWKGPRNRE